MGFLDSLRSDRRKDVEEFISRKFINKNGMSLKGNVGTIEYKGIKGIGTSNTEETTVDSTIILDSLALVDRQVKIVISRDKEGCEFAYENDIAVGSSVNRKVRLINTDFDVFINKEFEDEKKYIEEKKKIEKRIKKIKLSHHLDTFIQNRVIHNFGVWKKRCSKKNKELIGLVTIPSLEVNPIRDLATGELGGKILMKEGGDAKNIAFVQKGNTVRYTYDGQATYMDEYFYLTKDSVIHLGATDRGKYVGVSDVMRSLRQVEIKKTMENVLDLLARRFGPQIWVTVGNEINNLSTAELPTSYLRDVDGNAIDPATARANFKDDSMTALQADITPWVDGDALVQLAEFGIKADVINPTSNLLDYKKYIDMTALAIKISILNLDSLGRVDITSGIQNEALNRGIKDAIIKERKDYIDMINSEIINEYLELDGFEEDAIFVKFKPLEAIDERIEAEIELLKSDAIYNYMKGGWSDIPEYLKEMWKITTAEIKEKVTSMEEMKQQQKDQRSDNNDDTNNTDDKDDNSKKSDKLKDKDKKKKSDQILRRRIDDQNRGR